MRRVKVWRWGVLRRRECKELASDCGLAGIGGTVKTKSRESSGCGMASEESWAVVRGLPGGVDRSWAGGMMSTALVRLRTCVSWRVGERFRRCMPLHRSSEHMQCLGRLLRIWCC
jgi:hypothetical protein